MLTQEKLKSFLRYNPKTGYFYWLKSKGAAKRGRRAGAVDGRGMGYIEIRIDGHLHKAHRLAFLYMTGSFPSYGVDHIDGDHGNNSWENLRQADQHINSRNTCLRSDNTSGQVGVCWDKRCERWYSRIHVESGKAKFLGYFDNKESAIRARKRAEALYGYHPNHGRAA